MKILFLGDVMGRAGRAAVAERLPKLREAWKLDFVVVNGENASGGMGLTAAHAKDLFEAGADCVTLGDHAFDQKDMMQAVEREGRLIRPLNYAKAAPGRGNRVFTDGRGRKVLVAQVLGNVFMRRAYDDPFSAIDAVLGALCRRRWSTCTARRPPRKWRWAISATGAPALWWARIPIFPRRMPRFCPVAPRFRAMRACAAIT